MLEHDPEKRALGPGPDGRGPVFSKKFMLHNELRGDHRSLRRGASCHAAPNMLDDFKVNACLRPQEMPSLFRFLTVVAVIAGIIYGVIFSLANFVQPKSREMTVTIPPDKFLKK
jgi:hypothetical protein